MKRSSAMFLRVVVVLVGIGTFVFMLWEPHLEGRNAHATWFQIYFNDPFLAYAYAASIAFFVGLHQTFRLIGYMEREESFSGHILKALRTIRYCTAVLIAFIAGAEAYFFAVRRTDDDIAGGVAIGVFLIACSFIVAAATTLLERILSEKSQKNFR